MKLKIERVDKEVGNLNVRIYRVKKGEEISLKIERVEKDCGENSGA